LVFTVSRAVARLGAVAAGLVVAGALAAPAHAAAGLVVAGAPAAPAHAAPVHAAPVHAAAVHAVAAGAVAAGADLEVAVTGTTIAGGGGTKLAKAVVTNHGPDTPSDVVLTVDKSALDETKVHLIVGSDCTLAASLMTCPIDPEDVPDSGGSLGFLFELERQGLASGGAGSLTVSVDSATPDPATGNNEVTVAVAISTSGADLVIVAFDVHASDGTSPIPPGDTSELIGFFANQGDVASVGLTIVISLPEHVTFAEIFSDCTYSADNRVATCTDATFPLDPGDGFPFAVAVKVAADAPGPGALAGGLTTVTALGVRPPDVPEVAPARFPSFLKRVVPNLVPDVDPTDNEDAFAVFVAAVPDLPVTGSRAGLYAVSGAGLLVLGAMLVLLARLRVRRPTTVA